MTRPPDVTLDDLAAPRFTPHVAEILASVEPMAAELRLDPDELVALACEAEGVDRAEADFGDERFREPLAVLCVVPDPRRERCEVGLAFLDEVMPHFKRMHEMTTDHVHEEIQLLAIDFSTMLFESVVPLPSYRDWWDATDQTASYEYLKDVLRVLTFERGGDRWVLKSPQHLAQFPVLAEVFPDATFVVTHRDPVAVTASMATMVAYSARMNLARPDPLVIGPYWAHRVEDLLRACVRDRGVLPAERTIDVRFDEFMADDVAMVRRIHELAGQPWDDSVAAALQAYMDDHPRGRHGGVVHDLAAVGIDRAEREAALAFYRDRFGV